eukprot:909131-Amphidinium_carterae.1
MDLFTLILYRRSTQTSVRCSVHGLAPLGQCFASPLATGCLWEVAPPHTSFGFSRVESPDQFAGLPTVLYVHYSATTYSCVLVERLNRGNPLMHHARVPTWP